VNGNIAIGRGRLLWMDGSLPTAIEAREGFRNLHQHRVVAHGRAGCHRTEGSEASSYRRLQAVAEADALLDEVSFELSSSKWQLCQ
jgi:hypothetical protein